MSKPKPKLITSVEYKRLRIIVLSIVFVSLALPTYIGMSKSELGTPSTEWNQALVWIKDNTPAESLIIAWWDYGYWIRYRAERQPFVTPSEESDRIPMIAKAFLTYGNATWPIGTDYIIIDENTAYNFTKVMAKWAGADYRDIDDSMTLAGRLYENKIPEGYRIVYGDKVKVFEYTK